MAQRYETYKNSGVQWIGEIPSHWGCVPFRRIATVKSNLVHPNDYLDFPQVSPDCIEKNSGRLISWKTVAESNVESDNHRFYKGQIIYSKIRPLLNKVIIAPFDGLCSADMYPIETITDTKYMQYYMLSHLFLSEVRNVTRDRVKMPKINRDELGQISTIVPPLAEQQSIVSYLDDKCSKIEEWLDKKQKEVIHLQELKQSVIADAVTRGLNPNVTMKQTNISWLPEVPEYWEILRAKHMFNKEQRPVEKGDEIVTCFRDGEVTLRKNRRTTGFTEATDYSHYQHICKGDLVIHQMDAFAGSAGVSDSDGMGTPVLSVCTPKSNNILNEYYAHIVRLMGKNGFILSLYRGIRERSSDFRFDTFAKLWLPVPPIEEQKQIVAHINDKTSKIDKLIANINKEIEGIKEYKQRLISDVVTGQIKVC